MKIKFLGAVGCVTGSCSLLEYSAGNTSFLVDCGMTQGEDDMHILNAALWPFVPARLRFVLLTHAHLDHCGLLGRLVREGFSGPVYCTRFTAELAMVNLLDAARLSDDPGMQFDVRRINFVAVDEYAEFEFGRHIKLAGDLEAAFYPSAHIGGACSIGIRWRGSTTEWHEIVFSGDLGQNIPANFPQPLLAPRKPLPTMPDYLVVESTYGNRIRDADHCSAVARMTDFEHIILKAIEHVPSKKGQADACLVIPCFSIHRVQELLVDLHSLLEVRLKEKILAVSRAFEEPSRIEEAIQNGIRANKVIRQHNIVSHLSESDHKRFYELFELREIAGAEGLPKDTFVLKEQSTEFKREAKEILERAVQPWPNVTIRIFVDSPMSNRTTRIYRKELCTKVPGDSQHYMYRNASIKEHLGARDEANVDFILNKLFDSMSGPKSPVVRQEFKTYSLTFCTPGTVQELMDEESPALNIVLSGSGMADIGPITMHLERELTNPRSTILLTGYAPPSSVAGRLRALLNTGKTGSERMLKLPSRIFPDKEIQANIEDLGHYYSGHADQKGLLDFIFTTIAPIKTDATATTVFVNHGNNDVRDTFHAAIIKRSKEQRSEERRVKAVEVPGRDRRWFDLNAGQWLPIELESVEETRDELLIRFLMEQRRTNDLLSELLKENRKRSTPDSFLTKPPSKLEPKY